MNTQRAKSKSGFCLKSGKSESYYCTNGQWYNPLFIGAGTGHSVKIWKTYAGAQRFSLIVNGHVEVINEE